MSKRKSRVWFFFEELDNDCRKVKCNQCQMIISRGGQGKSANTTSMNNHIKYRHPTLIPQLGSAIKCSTRDDSSQSQSQAEELLTTMPTPSTSVSSEVSLCQKSQQNIEDSIALQWSREDSRSRDINIAIGEMIALDNQPLSVVENTGFRNLMRKIKPKYNIPGRKYFTQNIIPQLYEDTKSEIRRGVMSATALSVTTDMLTNINNKDSFLSFTAHWFDDSFKYHHAVLQMKHFPEAHTAHNIKNCLEEIPTLWDIDTTKIHAVVRDNGRNVTKAIDDSVFKGVPCFINTLQLAINTALKHDTMAQLLVKSRRIVTHFNHSNQAQSKLCDLQRELNLSDHQLVQDVCTRWNSTYYMISRLFEQKRAISLYLAKTSVNFENLSNEEWKILGKIIELLKPFEEITKIISSSCSSVSEVIPHLKTLQKYLQIYNDENKEIMEMKVLLENDLKSRFDVEYNKVFTLATLLDPRYKQQFFETEDLITIRSQFLLESLKNSMSDDDSDSCKDDLQSTSIEEDNTETTTHRNFWQCYQKFASRKIEDIQDDKSKAAHELQSYCALPVIKRNDDPFQWWRCNNSRYPEMSRIAKVYLCCPASSVYSERLFSEAGNIYETKRNRLLPERAEALVFLHHNLPLIKKYK
ncbi:zinc finger BED domain-containing protein 4-like [Choristoneura fumiferana]|uniref:zinc finger BED domain-containing protein 4-like n=1 Tax=Choristoneura fumiferana TaxID=7141 RepID=UPI003D15E669